MGLSKPWSRLMRKELLPLCLAISEDLDAFYWRFSRHQDTTPLDFKLSISSVPIPNIPDKTSFVCCPRVGGGLRILGFASENLTGGLTSFIGPHDSCSTSVTMLRAWTGSCQPYLFNGREMGQYLTVIMLECCLNIIDSGVRHPASFQDIEPFLCRLRSSDLLDELFQFISMLDSI